MVSPYAFNVPGGVQFHVRDLAEHLLSEGHDVRVLAPADEDADLPSYVDSAGRAVPVPYNGSVARLLFGPVTAARVGRWIDRGGFDVLHVHEPFSPSVSMLAMMAADGAVVGTFHSSTMRSRALLTVMPLLEPQLEKLSGRIAVSREALRTIHRHEGAADALIIPNGVYVDRFATATVVPRWQGSDERPTIAFLGRLEEPRKGLSVLLEAMPRLLEARPGLRLLVAGPGDPGEALRHTSARVRAGTEFLGMVSEHDKASLLRSVDAYVAPNTGAESFGIILVEAMSATAPVVASDLPSFADVLAGGTAGALFRTGDPESLADTLLRLLDDPGERGELAARGAVRAREFDWSRVSADVMDVYETCRAANAGAVRTISSGRTKRVLRGRG
ncbi:GDP-mannose-dependent alpha-(1-2)-phosphatidylinositol mannosyltransferase [Flexivirga endophytica]|uniref:D-inositol 3-phosphate glycosyltransferase n=2 Tax=Flexivirga endophytica TaxID=1849103 RepID=A0A916WX10_9MICO|nr:GDP-mannose-dependent alpha-(1-2)-phosphatidylinositol mannosyltransferase [Flexivirga endophytica]GHB44801.1 GDP-mannose-dependent alpha-(1-2)-phosphatidylinositol mannosyltransferase [Flexivirga endophytica]